MTFWPIGSILTMLFDSAAMTVQTYRPIRRHATVQDFERWEAQAATMTDAELLYAAKDCRRVEALWRGQDGMVEGFYSDQASTYGDELRRRRQRTANR